MDKSSLTNASQALIKAVQKGLTISKDGLEVISFTGRFLKFKINESGRKVISLNDPRGKKAYVGLHRIQAFQKFGFEMFKPGIVVRHLDGNPLNNHWDNIDIGSQYENVMDRDSQDRFTHAKLAASFNRKLSESEAAQLRLDRDNGMTYSQLMTKYGLAKSTVSYIVNNKTYSD